MQWPVVMLQVLPLPHMPLAVWQLGMHTFNAG
jgi:hypothetical protein